MFRAIPVSNKICFDKQLKRNWKIHEQKLNEMKSKFSKQRAQQFTFLQQSKKRNVLKDIENRQIQRSNHILFKKIQQIQRKGNKNSYLQIQKDKSPQSFNRTLHEPFRKRQIFRIVGQNQQMLKRIRQKKSAYNVRQMQKQRKQIQKNISLISEFKYKDYPVTQTKVNLYMTQQKSCYTDSRITNRRQQSMIDNSECQPRCKTTLKNRNRGYRHNFFSQTSKQINDHQYIITTYLHKKYFSDKLSIFYIEVENLQNQLQKYRMQMSEQQLQKLLSKFYNNQLSSLVDNLDIDQKNKSCYLKFKNTKSNQQNQLDN